MSTANTITTVDTTASFTCVPSPKRRRTITEIYVLVQSFPAKAASVQAVRRAWRSRVAYGLSPQGQKWLVGAWRENARQYTAFLRHTENSNPRGPRCVDNGGFSSILSAPQAHPWRRRPQNLLTCPISPRMSSVDPRIEKKMVAYSLSHNPFQPSKTLIVAPLPPSNLVPPGSINFVHQRYHLWIDNKPVTQLGLIDA